jgi:hypothetical protein
MLRWNASGSRVLPRQAAPRWRAVRQGLALAALGHGLLLAVAVPGLLLAGLAPRADRLGLLPGGLGEEDVEWLGLVLASAAAPLGYLLLLAGQWLCLANAPQGEGAKEWMFGSLLCLLIAPVLFAAAHFSGGAANYAVFQRGLAAMDDLTLRDLGSLLQVAGAGLVLLSCLLFTQFQRAARRSLAERTSSRLADGYCLFVFLLLGASAGPAFTSRLAARHVVLQVLAVGWGVSWLWHFSLILGTRQAIHRTLRRLGLGSGKFTRCRLEVQEWLKRAINGTCPGSP